VTGTFSMHGVSKELTARVHYWGAADMGRGTKAGFEATFNVKRSEFEINYGIEQGALGDMVTVTAAFEVAAAK
jgi:polyisoprenoid-binding protein YceI